MSVSEQCIKRPLLTIALSLLVVMFGLLGFQVVPVTWLPAVRASVLTVETAFYGASAATVESSVTQVVEDALGNVAGVDYITSWSDDGKSTITVYCHLNADIDAVASNIRGAIAGVREQLPQGAQMPVVSTQNPSAHPTLVFGLESNRKSVSQLSDYAENFMLPPIDSLPGVGNVEIWGGKKYAMRVWLRPEKMAAHHVTVPDIIHLLKTQNVAVSAGEVTGSARFLTVSADAKLQTAADFSRLVVSDRHNQLVRLGAVADVAIGALRYDKLLHINGKPAIAISVVPQPGADHLAVVHAVQQAFHRMQKNLPMSMTAMQLYDQTAFTQAAIANLYKAVFAVLLLVLVLLVLFVRHIAGVVLPVVSIGICVMGAFGLIFLLGYSINALTLLAILISIGLMAGKAGGVLTHCQSAISKGLAPVDAAILTAQQTSFSMRAMTVVLLALTLPLVFASGVEAAYCREFAFVLAGTSVMAWVVFKTVVPLLCARLLVKDEQPSAGISRLYPARLSQIKVPMPVALSVLVGVIALGCVMWQVLPSELAPSPDQNAILITANAPPDASFDYTKAYVPSIEHALTGVPGVYDVLTQVMTHSFISGLVTLVPSAKRALSDRQIAAIIQSRMHQLRGLSINVTPLSTPLQTYSVARDANEKNVKLVISTMASYKSLYEVTQSFLRKAETIPGLMQLDSHLKWNAQKLHVTIDRQLAANLQVPMGEITQTIATMLGSNWVSNYQYNGKNYRLLMQLNQSDLSKVGALDLMFVRAKNGKMIPLSSLVATRLAAGPEKYLHVDRLRADEITAQRVPGYGLDEVLTSLQTLAQQLPDGYKASFIGLAKTYLESGSQMLLLGCLALLFIYLSLVALFESFIDSLVIMSVLPFALFGALSALLLADATLNFYTELAMVTLMGLVVSNSVAVIDAANVLVKQGQSAGEAIVAAATQCCRPALMMTLCLMAAVIPLFFSTHGLQQVAIVIMGGTLVGGVASLLVMPALYCSLSSFKSSI